MKTIELCGTSGLMLHFISVDESFNSFIDEVWNAAKISNVGHKVNWLRLEQLQREIFRLVQDKKVDDRAALLMLSESLAAFTGRGACL